jgi:putative secretion ATPase (PEP-CTERM system associated)
MYTDFYRLKGEPFMLTPDHQFYFESRVHAQAMAHLMYGLKRGEGFIVITGEVGAGKTTIIRRLCANIGAGDVVAAHIVTTLLSGNELLRMVCSNFGIADVPDGKDAVIRRLQAFFEQVGRAGHKALLIVDEAQNLSPESLEELRMLSNFQVGNASPCQIFLVGQPQFRKLLADPDLEQLRQRVIASYHLSGLSPDECGDYVLHRLSRVGWANDPIFKPDALQAVFQHTGGIPRRINTLCSRLLLFGFLDNMHVFSSEEVARVAADMTEETGVALANVADNLIGLGDGRSAAAVAERLEDLEHRLDLQEKSISRIYQGLRHTALALADVVLGPGRNRAH